MESVLFHDCNQSAVFVNIVCDKCDAIIRKINVLRSVREVLSQSNNRCTYCGALLNPAAFAVKATKA